MRLPAAAHDSLFLFFQNLSFVIVKEGGRSHSSRNTQLNCQRATSLSPFIPHAVST